jgi:hypothetical protein
MNCKKIREFLITDYLDNETGREVSAEIEKHLSGCPECRAFYNTIRESISGPFENIETVPAPARVWNRIKEEIESRKGLGLLDRFFGYFKEPKYAFSFTALVLAALIVNMYVVSPVRYNEAGMDAADSQEATSYIQNTSEIDTYEELADYDEGDTFHEYCTEFNTSIEEFLL